MNPDFKSSLGAPPPARFSAALLKVASRCNLNCDYCYVYKHADQSWRDQPKLIADKTVHQFGQRLDEYVFSRGLDRFSVIFHGGEPLLYGAERLVGLAEKLRGQVQPSCNLDFSLQTNGVLLTDRCLYALSQAGIAVSLSLDGSRRVHDRHRLDHGGKSTFDDTLAALHRLIAAGSRVFSGVIAVIDPAVPAEELFEFFSPMELPRLDFLLPDATHAVPPPGRGEDESCYRRWLVDAFELWFRKYPDLPIRWFDAVLASRLGVPSPTDVMGFGNVSLVVVETDGSYTDHDVFKITGDNGARLGATVFNTALAEVGLHAKVREHGYRLTFDGLGSECKTCPVVVACGGGSVMHRAHPERGLDAPTVYCGEMFGLLSKATELLRDSLTESVTGPLARLAASGAKLVECCTEWRRETDAQAIEKARSLGIDNENTSAAAIFLVELSRGGSAAGTEQTAAMWLGSIKIQSSDLRLVEPFLNTIRPLAPNSVEVSHAVDSLAMIEECLCALDPMLPAAMAALLSDIIFVETSVPAEDGIFSFSDDEAPNVLYIAPYASGRPISPSDLADSIYHEFRHQVLYHFERGQSLLFDRVHPKFPAPWRPGLRHSGGFLHGTFVFTGLAKYWCALATSELPGVDHSKAKRNADRAAEQAAHGIRCLREFALLTPTGLALVDDLAVEMSVTKEPLQARGVTATA